jgi:carbohydrate-selective porin OprB
MNGVRSAHAETNIEATYRRAIKEWLIVQADIQHILHPNMVKDLNAAWIFGLRLELAKAWRW